MYWYAIMMHAFSYGFCTVGYDFFTRARIQFRQDNRRDKIATLVKNQKHPLPLVPSRQGRGRLCFYEKNKIITLLFLIGHGYC